MGMTGKITPLVVRVLRGRIASGVYIGKLPGERVLAAELKTDPRTVQNALIWLTATGLVRRRANSGTYVVPPEERVSKGVLLHARILAPPPYVGATVGENWSWLIVYGFKMAAEAREIAVVTDYRDSAEKAVHDAIVECVAPNCVGVCVLALPIETSQAIRLAAARGAIVLGDCTVEQPLVPAIRFDDIDAGRLAAEHLVTLGHRRIAFAMPDIPGGTGGPDRLKGVQDYLAGAGQKLSRLEVYPQQEHPSAFDRLMSGPDRPTALIVTPPHAANILLAIAAAKGVNVPRELSLITFGDPRTLHNPALSLVAVDFDALGRRAFEALLDEELLADPRYVLLPGRLLPRATTAPPG